MLTTKQQLAEQMLQAAQVLTVATVDKMGFPCTTALTPLPHDRSLKHLFFYTGRQTETVQNILERNQATIFAFNLSDYSSIMLKGSFHLLNQNNFPQDWRQDLSDFQISLHYQDPVIVVFQTIAVKLRQNHEVAYFSTENQSL